MRGSRSGCGPTRRRAERPVVAAARLADQRDRQLASVATTGSTRRPVNRDLRSTDTVSLGSVAMSPGRPGRLADGDVLGRGAGPPTRDARRGRHGSRRAAAARRTRRRRSSPARSRKRARKTAIASAIRASTPPAQNPSESSAALAALADVAIPGGDPGRDRGRPRGVGAGGWVRWRDGPGGKVRFSSAMPLQRGAVSAAIRQVRWGHGGGSRPTRPQTGTQNPIPSGCLGRDRDSDQIWIPWINRIGINGESQNAHRQDNSPQRPVHPGRRQIEPLARWRGRTGHWS